MLTLLLATIAGAAEPKQLTKDGTFKFSPVFVDGGKAILYSQHVRPNLVAICRLDLKTGKSIVLDKLQNAHQFDPHMSRDGRFICYGLSSGNPQIYLSIRDLKKKTEATFQPSGSRSTIRSPKFTPDNKRIVFTISAPGGQQIASVDLQGKRFKKLTESQGTNCWPDVSPNGKQILFCSSRTTNFEIYVMNMDGSKVRQLTKTPLREMRPAWSPDGKRIAFTSVRSGNHDIYVMDADGRNVRRITTHPDRDDYARWHPNGRQLLVTSRRDGKTDLYLLYDGLPRPSK